MRTLARKARATVCALLSLTFLVSAVGKNLLRYPNELKGFQFYGKYLAPLQPGSSDETTVRRVLGDTAAVHRNGWTISTYYESKGGPISNPTLGSLAEITLTPDGVIRMGAVKFSNSFDHCHGSVSEINISLDVYYDTSGLQYWLHESDSGFGKKGDLYQIVYGSRRKAFLPNTFC